MGNKEAYRGVGQVFRFSLQQYFKQKATFVMLIVMLIASVGSVYIMSVSMNRGQKANRDGEVLYVLNESPYELDLSQLPDYMGKNTVTGSGEEWLERVKGEARSVLLWVDRDPEGGWQLRACTGEKSKVSSTEAARIADMGREALRTAQLRATGATEAQLAEAFAGFTARAVSQKEYLEPEENGDSFDQNRFILGFVYAMITYMLVSMSVSYVVRAVAEEKSSKLVDMLMVSVRPLALVWGKILAAMCVVLAGILVIALGLTVSRTLLGVGSEMLTGGVSIGSILSGLGLPALLSILVSLVLGYLSFSIAGGIAGASCAGEEGVDSAVGSVTLFSMVGYLAGIITGISGNRTLQYVVSLLPFLSCFTAPARYISGDIPFWVLLLSWVLQALAALLLGRFCGAVYASLLIHRGEKVKLRQLLAIFKSQRGVRA
jgi:ABC-type Na+ efflux pump permease subunit